MVDDVDCVTDTVALGARLSEEDALWESIALLDALAHGLAATDADCDTEFVSRCVSEEDAVSHALTDTDGDAESERDGDSVEGGDVDTVGDA